MKRFVIAVLLLGLTAAYVRLHPPANLAAGRGVLKSVPETFGPWIGTERSFDDGVADELQADDLLLRRYEQGGQIVWLCVVYHQNRRYGSHDPHLCYESQGFVLGRESTAHVDDGTPKGIDVSRFVAERKGRRRVVWYWYSTDGLSTRDAGSFRRRMALLGALDNRSWGSFIRVESVATDGDIAAAEARVRDFSSRVATALPGVFAQASRAAQAAPAKP